jgi:hypothetical protein
MSGKEGRKEMRYREISIESEWVFNMPILYYYFLLKYLFLFLESSKPNLIVYFLRTYITALLYLSSSFPTPKGPSA